MPYWPSVRYSQRVVKKSRFLLTSERRSQVTRKLTYQRYVGTRRSHQSHLMSSNLCLNTKIDKSIYEYLLMGLMAWHLRQGRIFATKYCCDWRHTPTHTPTHPHPPTNTHTKHTHTKHIHTKYTHTHPRDGFHQLQYAHLLVGLNHVSWDYCSFDRSHSLLLVIWTWRNQSMSWIGWTVLLLQVPLNC